MRGVTSILAGALQLKGKKYDNDKAMFDLIPPLAELEVARVLTYGAKKYEPENWRYVEDATRRYTAAARRHINSAMQGEQCDPETGYSHYAHAICCLMFMLEMELEKRRKEEGA